MSVNIREQETTVNFMRDSEKASIYTSDSTMMTKLDKLAADENVPHWKLAKVHKDSNGEIVGKTYKTHKRLISFRADIVTREMTPEQKEAAAARMREWQKRKQEGGGPDAETGS